ncbi:GrpE nucleotide exchange factor [Moorella glycerini]|uniref:Protein GrpE n=1 Tax=Neomoorella stamsii TaxID=1266720 RepID=A0A9X7P7H7_9FIRM|nr:MULTISPECIES: nucleotide exchange factor GrpE [Moorella]PRR77488.1 heat shock protein GrpE [Moorella stamsii]CEP68237.1 GrpE nucleotide exchange factor [Moorella glycerini]
MDAKQDNKDNKMNNGPASGEREERLTSPGEPPAGEAGEAATPEAKDGPAGAGEEPGEENEILTRLQAELAAKEEALAGLQQRYLRLQADFDNYRKRTRREQEELTRLANARLIESLLPVLDNLERALAAAAGAEKQALETGVEMTLRLLKEILSQEGLMPVAALGQPFDPEVHEAVAREETPELDKINLVVEEFRRGYTLHGKLLRPAMVKVAVAAGATEQETKQEAGEQEVDHNG